MGILKTIKRKSILLGNLFSKNYNIKGENIIITGSNSGIGLELLKKLSKENNIIALVNKSFENIEIRENTRIIQRNFENLEFDEIFIKELSTFKPNILINSAANFGPENQSLENINTEDFQRIININVLSPLKLIQFCLEGHSLKQVVNMTSGMGSLTNGHNGGFYYYRTTKSMLNSISKNISFDLKKKNINIFCLQPGNVKTKMNRSGVISPEFSAQKIINILAENNPNFSGKLIDINRNILQW